MQKKKNEPPAEHQGPMLYPLNSFAALENLVRLSLLTIFTNHVPFSPAIILIGRH